MRRIARSTSRSAVAALIGATLVTAPALAQETADRIWTGGPILTMNDEAMRAEAVAERGGKIVAVGTKASVMKLEGSGTKVIDLQGRTMLPGFVDAHGHVVMGGLQALSANLLASYLGAILYMPTLLEVPIIGTTFGYSSGAMAAGPALALLLSGPTISAPSLVVLGRIMGMKKTLVYAALVIVMSTIAGMIFGALIG